MILVNRKNTVHPVETVPQSPVMILKDLLENMGMVESNLIETNMRKLLLNVLNKYNPKVMVHEDGAEIKSLKKYLRKTNELLTNEIMGFIDKNGNLNQNEYDKIQAHVMDIYRWNLDKTTHKLGDPEYTDPVFVITQFIKTSIKEIGKILPNNIVWN